MSQTETSQEILTMSGAVQFTQLSRNTLGALVRNGDLRAIRVGKGLRFIKEDLLFDLRALAGKKKVIDKITGKITWQSVNAKAAKSGTFVSPHRVEEEFNSLLEQTISKQRKGYMTS